MVNSGEVPIKAVMFNKPKLLIGLDQKVSGQVREASNGLLLPGQQTAGHESFLGLQAHRCPAAAELGRSGATRGRRCYCNALSWCGFRRFRCWLSRSNVQIVLKANAGDRVP